MINVGDATGAILADKNSVRPVQRMKQPLVAADRFRNTEDEHAAGGKRVMEYRNHPILQIVIHVNQQIPARDQVDAGERRIAYQAVGGKRAEFAHLLADRVAVGAFGKKPRSPFGRNAVQQGRRKTSGPGGADRDLIDIAGEYLDFGNGGQGVHVLAQQYRQRVCLFPGGTSRHPDPQVIGRVLTFEQAGNDVSFQNGEHRSIAEKAGHADQQVAKQQHNLFAVGFEAVDVVVVFRQPQHLHPPLHAPHEGLMLVLNEIVAEVGTQNATDCPPDSLAFRPGLLRVVRRRETHLPGGKDVTGHLLDGGVQIDSTRGYGAGWHAGIFRPRTAVTRTIPTLGEGQATPRLDCLEAERAVMTGAGQDDADGVLGETCRHGVKQTINGCNTPPRIRRNLAQRQVAITKFGYSARRDDQDMVGDDPCTIACFDDRHRGPTRQYLREHTSAAGREVQDDDKRQPTVGRHIRKKLVECLYTSGRSADPDNRLGCVTHKSGYEHRVPSPVCVIPGGNEVRKA
jgi:hypothetical protein